MRVKNILALAERLTTAPAYSEHDLATTKKFTPHRDAPISDRAMLIGVNQRDVIVKALRFYAYNRKDMK